MRNHPVSSTSLESDTKPLTPPFRRLKLLTILAPVVFFGVLDLFQHVLYPRLFSAITSYLVAVGIVFVGTLAFSEMIFRVVNRMQNRLVQQNRELLALHQAGLDIAGELQLEVVLQKIVDRARELVGARYGVLSLLREEGGMETVLTSGGSDDERKRVMTLVEAWEPTILAPGSGGPSALRDASAAPSSSAGTVPSRPRSLVAVPIRSRGRVLGNLYVAEATRTHAGFDANDEKTLFRFATQAALAIENARLHRRIQALAVTAEREWIARELHDTLAQVLGYVNTKAQAAEELLRTGQLERAMVQISQLGEAARAAYADVREGILGLRTSVSPERDFQDTIREYLDSWQEQSGIAAELNVALGDGASPHLSPSAEIQLLRILQEALANVRKHACATCVHVSLAEEDDAVTVVVEDDGIGFDPSTLGRAGFPRFGLATMRERAEAIGGSMAIHSAPGQGTRIQLTIPLETASATKGGETRARLDC
jgi:nitrate/nitrite-specific signal transduction histidine kinase